MKLRNLFTILAILLINLAQAQMYNVEFRVDVSQQDVGGSNVHLAGEFNGWCESCAVMIDEGNGIYSYVAQMEAGSYAYKYNIGGWSNGENLTQGDPCTVTTDFTNRITPEITEDTVLPTVCWNSCEACPPVNADAGCTDSAAQNYNAEATEDDGSCEYLATFQVDMSNETVVAQGVYVAGDFNSWAADATPLTDTGNGIWSLDISLRNGETFAYTFLNGPSYDGQEAVPMECGVENGFGGYNREYVATSENAVLDLVCFSECAACGTVITDGGCTDSNAQNYDAEAAEDDGSCEYLSTFQVDMTDEMLAPEGVYIVGDFNDWTADATPLTDMGDGIWSVTIPLLNGETFAYTFLNGPTYDGQEEVPMACGVENGFGGYNRSVTAENQDIQLDVVCFGGCNACGIVQVPVLIVFQVDMNNETPSAEGVYIVGDFNEWDATATQMVDLGGGIWQAGVLMTEGQETNYKFLNGPSFDNEETVPMECGVMNDFGGFDRNYVAGSETETLEPVCFNGCGSCEVIETVNITFAVDMSNETVDANGVHIAGSFNDFSPTATVMNPAGAGIYEVTVAVDQNSEITYKFINGNDFATVEIVPFECGINDGFGGYNRNYVTMTSDVALAPVCFGECDADCDAGGGETINMTFRVDMSEQVVDANGVHLAGSFNGFSPTANPMTDAGNGIYEANLNVPQNAQITFKYINGNDFATSETVPFECGEEDGFGGYNRFYNTTTSAVSLNPVCFSACDPCIIDNINETVKSELKVGPNPIASEGILTIGGENLSELYLMDLTGRTWKLEISNNAAKLPSLASGVYVIQDPKSGLRTQILVR